MKEKDSNKGFSKFIAGIKAFFSKKNKNAEDNTQNVNNEPLFEEQIENESYINEATVFEDVIGEQIGEKEEYEEHVIGKGTQVEQSEQLADSVQVEQTEETEPVLVETEVVDNESEVKIDQESTQCCAPQELTPQQEYVQSHNINVNATETLVKSFVARVALAQKDAQDYYNELKNYALSFKGTRYRISWQYDSIYKTRILLTRFVMKGKYLWVYVALDCEEVPEGTKFTQTNDRKYEGLKVGLKIQGQRTLKQAKTLIRLASEKMGLVYNTKEIENYVLEGMTEDEMIEKGLIKKVLTSTNPQ